MKLLSFIASLLPRMSKDEILEDLRITKEELEGTVLPLYKAAVEQFNKKALTSKDVEELTVSFYRNYDLRVTSKVMIEEVYKKLPIVLELLEKTEEELETLLEQDIIKEGLTAKKAILIRMADYLSFISKYSVDLLNFVYSKEIQQRESSETYELTRMQEETIKKNIVNFARILSVVATPKHDYEKKLEELPEVVINSQTEHAVAAVYKENKLDPFGGGVMTNFQGSPIYHIRLMFAEFQANRYKAMKDKKRMLELKLLNLKLQQEEGSSDHKLEREIGYIQNRVDAMEYKMAKAEESVR